MPLILGVIRRLSIVRPKRCVVLYRMSVMSDPVSNMLLHILLLISVEITGVLVSPVGHCLSSVCGVECCVTLGGGFGWVWGGGVGPWEGWV